MVSKIKKNILVAQNTRTIWKFDSLKKKTDQLYGPPYIYLLLRLYDTGTQKTKSGAKFKILKCSKQTLRPESFPPAIYFR
jgi:hypothetical protein